MSVTTAKTKVKDKIASLLKKTTANGCSESEADQAMQLANRLIEKNGLRLAEFQGEGQSAKMPKTKIVFDEYYSPDRNVTWFEDLAFQIGFFLDVRTLHQKIVEDEDGDRSRMMLFGLKANIELFHQLHDILSTACLDEWEVYKERTGSRNRGKFLKGAVVKLTIKMQQIKHSRNAIMPADFDTKLEKKIVKVLPDMKIRMRKVKKFSMDDDTIAGFIHADKIAINPAVKA